MIPVAVDTETFLIGPGNVAPPLVCVSAAYFGEDGKTRTELRGNHEDDAAEGLLLSLLIDTNLLLVFHNAAFDLTVMVRTYPRLLEPIFNALLAGRITDTKIREKLLNLSTTGRLDKVVLPDGSTEKIPYGLADLELAYLGLDRSAQKEGEDVWRMNYSALDGWRAADYPEDAREYALEDATGTLRVYYAQEERKLQWSMATTATEEFQTASDFCLRLETCWGMEVNQEAVARMRETADAILAENESLLVQRGILRPSVPAAPYKSQQKRAYKLMVDEHGESLAECGAWDDWQDFLEARGIKFTAPKAASVNTKVLQAYAEALYKRLGQIPTMTDGGKSGKPQIKLDAEIQEYLATKDEVMAQYRHRQEIQKIVTNQLPVLEGAKVIHFNYDVLKETGRTSSYGNSKNREPLYPAISGQQVPAEIRGMDPRQNYSPRAGTVFFDVDLEGLELACVGQVTHTLFRKSVHLTRYNQGYNLHTYLGSQLAIRAEGHPVAREFSEACRAEGILGDADAVYQAFLDCKGHAEDGVRAFFKHFRTFAKPVGLGFPGGLGPATMVEFARKTYGVVMTEQEAAAFREMWLETYPEMVQFFRWVNGQVDEFNHGGEDTVHWYETPLGMVRRGASYCAAANGACMQSPGAEVAKAGLIQLQRACYLPGANELLFGARPIAFVHDQHIGETTRDQDSWHEQCMEVSRIMVDAAALILPDVKMRTEPLLTRVWSKSAVPTFDGNGRLIPWEPEA